MKTAAALIATLFTVCAAGCSMSHPLLPAMGGSARSPHHDVLQNGGSPQNWTTFSPKGSGGHFVGVVVGPDNNLWFDDANNEVLVRVTMTGSPKILQPSVAPFYLTVGADKKFYVANGDDGQIGTMTTAGVTNRFSTPSGDHPTSLTLGPDGNVWFIEFHHVGKITKKGVITEFTLPDPFIGGSGITSGPDGNIWFTENQVSKIGKVTPTGTVTVFPIGNSCLPNGIVRAKDGNLWFRCGSNIGRITPAGVITLVPTTTTGNNFVQDMAEGPDGDPWFTDDNTGIHEIDTSTLAITDFTPPNSGFNNYTLITGPDGNVWVGAIPDVINVYIPNPLSVTPKSIAFTGNGQMKTLTVTESGTHAWTATSSNIAVATVAQGGKASQFVVTSVGTGKATITIADAVGNLFKVKVSVP